MTEDELYRTSTQYRLWSYTPDGLAALRAKTNILAAERVRSAVRRSRNQHENEALDMALDCLTVKEEQKLVDFYCVKAMELADFCEFPTNIKVPPHRDNTAEAAGDGGTISQTILPDQLADDLPSQGADGFRCVPGNQD